MSNPFPDLWTEKLGVGPVVATAIHDGHEVRESVRQWMSISSADRLREEDPFTGRWAQVTPTSIVARRSRFEVDLNRPRETAVYLQPEDAWGLKVWDTTLPPAEHALSLAEYDHFYDRLAEIYADLLDQHGHAVVLDLHSYNHMRMGPQGPPEDGDKNPDINIGTGTLFDRSPWEPLIEHFIADLRAYAFPGRTLDVRENVRFRGGHCARWTHATFPDRICVLSVEVKKFFMDEWTGEPDGDQLAAIEDMLASTLPGMLEELDRI